MTTQLSDDEYRPGCDYVHAAHDPADRACWFFQGESGEFYVCDEHFQMRSDEGKRGWVRF